MSGSVRDEVARPQTSAGALFTNAAREVLLVRTTYKQPWEIPGGYVQPGESPRAACQREIGEELGICPRLGDLLVVDWAPASGEGDKLLFVFDGDTLTERDTGRITFADGEVAEIRYVPPAELLAYTVERLVRRVRAALAAKERGGPVYLEHGRPPTAVGYTSGP